MRTPTISVLALAAVIILTGCCMKFNDLPSTAEYSVGDTLTTSGKAIVVEAFQRADGTLDTGGTARVDSQTHAQGSGRDLNARNVNLNFKLNYPLTKLTVKFAELGGNNNFKVNGDFRYVADLISLNGTAVGAVQVTVNAVQQGVNWYGEIILSGVINEFVIGGQELWLDDLCKE